MSQWYGETKDYTPNELNFMVRAYTFCQDEQAHGKCEPGSDCVSCKYGPAIGAMNSLDPLTKSRVIDKSDTYKLMLDTMAKAEKKKESFSMMSALIVAVAIVVLALVFLLPFIDVVRSGCTLPSPEVPVTYDGRACLNKVMARLNKEGPVNYVPDGKVDCKDWSLTFLIWWYYDYDMPDKTCIIVHNDNGNKFNHALVAVWYNDKWNVIEPQACNKKDWTPESYWGKQYDKEYNLYCDTDMFIIMLTTCSINFRYNLAHKVR